MGTGQHFVSRAGLRAFLERERMLALLRDGAYRGKFMVPSSLMNDGKWFVTDTNLAREPTHGFQQICQTVGGFELKVVVPKDRGQR